LCRSFLKTIGPIKNAFWWASWSKKTRVRKPLFPHTIVSSSTLFFENWDLSLQHKKKTSQQPKNHADNHRQWDGATNFAGRLKDLSNIKKYVKWKDETQGQKRQIGTMYFHSRETRFLEARNSSFSKNWFWRRKCTTAADCRRRTKHVETTFDG